VRIAVTAAEIEGRSAREVRLLVFRKLAEPFYRGGVREVAPVLGIRDPKAVARFERDAALLRLFTRESHDRIGRMLLGLALASLVLAALLMRFSFRLGRLASPGLVLLVAGVPALVLSAVIRANENAEPGRSAGYVLAEVTPTVLEPLRFQYVIVLALGAAMLLGAALGKLARRVGPAWATIR
jgi:hypothetical protein